MNPNATFRFFFWEEIIKNADDWRIMLDFKIV